MDDFRHRVTAQGADLHRFSMLRICRIGSLHFLHFMFKLFAFGFFTNLAGLGIFTGGSFPVVFTGRLAFSLAAALAGLRCIAGGVSPVMAKRTAGRSIADLALSRAGAGSRTIIMDYFRHCVTAEGANPDNLSVLCICRVGPLHFLHFVLKLAALGQATGLAGLGIFTGGSFPVMTEGGNGLRIDVAAPGACPFL